VIKAIPTNIFPGLDFGLPGVTTRFVDGFLPRFGFQEGGRSPLKGQWLISWSFYPDDASGRRGYRGRLPRSTSNFSWQAIFVSPLRISKTQELWDFALVFLSWFLGLSQFF